MLNITVSVIPEKDLQCNIRAALSNQNVLVATFVTFVATECLLSPQLREICHKNFNFKAFYYKISIKKNFLLLHLNGLSPHVANGDRVGQHCIRGNLVKSTSMV